MKKLRLLNAAALILITLFSSCDTEPIDSSLLSQTPGENPGDGDGETPEDAVFKVDFNNATWTATTTQAIYNDDYLAITGIKADGAFFQITVPHPHVGTFEFAATPPDPSSTEGVLAMAYMAPGEPSGYIADSDDWGSFSGFPDYVDTAQVIITEIDTVNETVTGTFRFTGARVAANPDPEIQILETITFTNGEFTNVSYGATVVTPNDNELSVKLDGETYTPTSVNAISLMGNISISAMRGSVETIGITFPATVTEGNYTMGMLTYVGQYNLDQTATGIFGASGGTLTITTHDTASHHVTGTFHFTATSFTGGGTHEITDGTFDITY